LALVKTLMNTVVWQESENFSPTPASNFTDSTPLSADTV